LSTTDTRTNAEIVLAFWDALTRRELDVALGLLDDDAVFWIAGSTPISGDHDKTWFSNNLRGQNPDFRRPAFEGSLRLEVVGTTAEGDRVATEVESEGVLADGTVYRNQYHHLFRVEAGRIVLIREYMDTMLANATFCADELRR
jgi:ketosteroid isomerase-like protein